MGFCELREFSFHLHTKRLMVLLLGLRLCVFVTAPCFGKSVGVKTTIKVERQVQSVAVHAMLDSSSRHPAKLAHNTVHDVDILRLWLKQEAASS